MSAGVVFMAQRRPLDDELRAGLLDMLGRLAWCADTLQDLGSRGIAGDDSAPVLAACVMSVATEVGLLADAATKALGGVQFRGDGLEWCAVGQAALRAASVQAPALNDRNAHGAAALMQGGDA
ncbi:MAG TPA: hypothetical protein VFR90_04950 [Methylibium sp.]|uniref:hypothetical protein n=1 Tax=Methylibium sp. TaxID=2067992 RepID=UPI002DBC9A91|nr:hypothetical protein [Methylibium sp.]HEU4458449.1 hypothetical protein [Methylibium sp.]